MGNGTGRAWSWWESVVAAGLILATTAWMVAGEGGTGGRSRGSSRQGPPPSSGTPAPEGARSAAVHPEPAGASQLRTLTVRVEDEEGSAAVSAWLFLPDEPAGQRWRRWTPGRSSVTISSGRLRVRAFSAELPAEPGGEGASVHAARGAGPRMEGDERAVAPALTAAWASRLTVVADTDRSVSLVLRARRGIVLQIEEPDSAGWLRFASAFVRGPNAPRPLVDGTRFYRGWQRKPLMTDSHGAYVEWSSLPPGSYEVGIRYPDRVLRGVRRVLVSSGVARVRMELVPPDDTESIVVDPRDELGGRLDDVEYRVESLYPGGRRSAVAGRIDVVPHVALHGAGPAGVAPRDVGHRVDLRGVPAAWSARHGEARDAAAWLYVTSKSRGQRVIPLWSGRLAGVSELEGPIQVPFRAGVALRVELAGARSRVGYEVALYLDRDADAVSIDRRRHFSRRWTSTERAWFPADTAVAGLLLREDEASDPVVRAAELLLAGGETGTLIVRQLDPMGQVPPIEVASARWPMEFGRRQKRPRSCVVQVPELCDLSLGPRGDGTGASSAPWLELRVRPRDGGWKTLLCRRVDPREPVMLHSIPEGLYRARNYRTSEVVEFQLKREEGSSITIEV